MTVILDVAPTHLTAHRVRAASSPRPYLREVGRWVMTGAAVSEALAVTVVVTSGHGLQWHALNRPLDRTGVETELLVLVGGVVFVAGRLFVLAARTPKGAGLVAGVQRLLRIVKGVQPAE